ncbi:MAG: metal-binding protein [Acidobacteriota bacterium]
MPSGRTHDAITFFLAVPTAVASYAVTLSVTSALVIGAAFLAGGLLFGPDLDTVSRQYTRWLFFKWLWFPYRHFFKHRSRFSHGLVLGALIRVIYFMGVLTALSFTAVYIWAAYNGGKVPNLAEITHVWHTIGDFIRSHLGDHFMWFVFLGLWLGAASHTFTDLAGSFIKTGRIAKFL